MHAAIIPVTQIVIGAGHLVRLRVYGRIFHVARRRRSSILTYQPLDRYVVIAFAIGLVYKFAPHVGKRFVDSARLVIIEKTRLILRDAMRDLVRHHIVCYDVAAISINHLTAIPKSITIARIIVMNRRFYRHAGVVNAIAAMIREVEIIRVACINVRILRVDIAARAGRIGFVAHQRAGQVCSIVSSVSLAVFGIINLVKTQRQVAAQSVYQHELADGQQFYRRHLHTPDQAGIALIWANQARVVNP